MLGDWNKDEISHTENCSVKQTTANISDRFGRAQSKSEHAIPLYEHSAHTHVKLT